MRPNSLVSRIMGMAARMLALAGMALPLALGGCASDSMVISQARQAHTGIEPAVLTDAELNSYIQRVGDRIIDAARSHAKERGEDADRAWMFAKDMRFHFVNSETLNAFTTGGEHMYIYTGLFRQAKSEDELAAVMAHEFAHVYGRHVHSGINRQYGIMGAAVAAGAAGYAYGGDDKGAEYAAAAAGVTALAGQFVGMHYTRGDETNADDVGFTFYVRAGWDPKKFDDFFEQMIEKGYDKGSEMLSDHPSLSRRVSDTKQRAADLPPEAKAWRKAPVATAPEFARLQGKAAQVGKSMPSDQSLAAVQELLRAMPRSCLTPAIQDDQKKAEQAVMARSRRAQQK